MSKPNSKSSKRGDNFDRHPVPTTSGKRGNGSSNSYRPFCERVISFGVRNKGSKVSEIPIEIWQNSNRRKDSEYDIVINGLNDSTSAVVRIYSQTSDTDPPKPVKPSPITPPVLTPKIVHKCLVDNEDSIGNSNQKRLLRSECHKN